MAADQLEQRLGRHELHHDPWQAVLDDDVEDGHHVLVAAQPRGVPGLPQRPLDPVGAFGRVETVLEVDFLERGVGQQHLVEGAPDRAHSAGTKPFDEPVPAGHKAVHLWSGSHVAPSVMFSYRVLPVQHATWAGGRCPWRRRAVRCSEAAGRKAGLESPAGGPDRCPRVAARRWGGALVVGKPAPAAQPPWPPLWPPLLLPHNGDYLSLLLPVL